MESELSLDVVQNQGLDQDRCVADILPKRYAVRVCDQTAIGAVVEPSAVVVVAVASALRCRESHCMLPNVAAIVFTIAIALLDVPVEVVVFQRYTRLQRRTLIRGSLGYFR